MLQARRAHAGAGTTAEDAIIYGGSDGTDRAYCEEWDGTAWATQKAKNTAVREYSGCGTTTAALGFAGTIEPGPGNTNITEEYTGTTSAAEAVDIDFD